MGNIVEKGLKIDLHIHSIASSKKDGKRVQHNTKENIKDLVEKLNQEQVNICAITDHDNFSYDIYSELKCAEKEENSIMKVLPGIEFSIQFEIKKPNKKEVLHVITIFSDAEESKVSAIEKTLLDNPSSEANFYTEEEFLNILRIIDIDTILIVHQKNTLSSKTPRKNDANSLGEEKFFEFIYTDYFEAYEFKNKRNEVLNKVYLEAIDRTKEVSFVSGTDCHDWRYYPYDESTQADSYPYTFVKCLPTFKGLVMAMTDNRRIKMVNSFFNVGHKYLEFLEIKNRDQNIQIPMSKGINVIIGDNSIGKSTLLHAMTGYSSTTLLPKNVKAGYEKYLKTNEVEIISKLKKTDVFCFDMQGAVRKRFEENNIQKNESYLEQYFPEPIDSEFYKNIVQTEITRMCSYLKNKFEIDNLIAKLSSFKVFISDKGSESLIFVKNLKKSKKDTEALDTLTKKISKVGRELDSLKKLLSDPEDKKRIEEIHSEIEMMNKKYSEQYDSIQRENNRIEQIDTIISEISEKHGTVISDEQKERDSFDENSNSLIDKYTDIINKKNNLPQYKLELKEQEITPKSRIIFDYEFISKLDVEKIDKKYIKDLIRSIFKKGTEINWESITEEQLKNGLLNYDDNIEVFDFIQQKLNAQLDKDFQHKVSILEKGMDKYKELSSGLNSRIYFDLLSHESEEQGIYIIDQPEDNISQTAIKDYVLDRFKIMGEKRQIIMVTHNPQFIVNLDVDNVIFIGKNDKGLYIQYGALEYICDDYDMLDIVANNIDGGLKTIQERWKRYEKNNNL